MCIDVDILRIGTVAMMYVMWSVEKKIDRVRVPILWISSGSWKVEAEKIGGAGGMPSGPPFGLYNIEDVHHHLTILTFWNM